MSTRKHTLFGADQKISEMTEATSVASTAILPIVSGGTNYYTTIANLMISIGTITSVVFGYFAVTNLKISGSTDNRCLYTDGGGYATSSAAFGCDPDTGIFSATGGVYTPTSTVGILTVTSTADLPSATTINDKAVCLGDGTNCAALSGSSNWKTYNNGNWGPYMAPSSTNYGVSSTRIYANSATSSYQDVTTALSVTGSSTFQNINFINSSSSDLFVSSRFTLGSRDNMVWNGTDITGIFAVNDTQALIEYDSVNNTAGAGTAIYGSRSRGSISSKSIVQNGDQIRTDVALGYDGTDFALGGYSEFFVDGTPGSNEMPTAWRLAVAPDGSQVPMIALNVSATGTLYVPNGVITTSSTVGTLTVTSTVNFQNATGSGLYVSGPMSFVAATGTALRISGPMSFVNASGSNLDLTGTLSANMCRATRFDLNHGGYVTYNSTTTRAYMSLGGCSGWGRTTAGTPTPSTYAQSNGLELCGTRFNATTTQYHQWSGVLPLDYVTGTAMTVQFYWTATGTTVESAAWSIRGVAIGNDDSLNASFGSFATSIQPFVGTSYDLTRTTSTAITFTPSGTPAPGEKIQFEARAGSDIGQTIGTDPILTDVRLIYQQRTGITEY